MQERQKRERDMPLSNVINVINLQWISASEMCPMDIFVCSVIKWSIEGNASIRALDTDERKIGRKSYGFLKQFCKLLIVPEPILLQLH